MQMVVNECNKLNNDEWNKNELNNGSEKNKMNERNKQQRNNFVKINGNHLEEYKVIRNVHHISLIVNIPYDFKDVI